MIITTRQSLEIYRLIGDFDKRKNALKNLSQKERKTVMMALRNLSKEKIILNGSSDREAASLIKKINNNQIEQEQSFFITKFFHSIYELFGLRISVNSILKERAKAHAVIQQEPKLDELDALIAKKKTNLKEWEEMLSFVRKDSRPLYEKIHKFYLKLPKEQPKAQVVVERTIKKIQSLLERIAKEENHKKEKTYIIEKEILQSLMNLRKYKGDDFKTEVEALIRVFDNSVKFANQVQKDTKVKISQFRHEIAKLKARRKFIMLLEQPSTKT